MQWSESEAVMIGGSDTNEKVMIFSPSSAWIDSNATLAQPLKDLRRGKVTVSVKDKQGNVSRIERTFSVMGRAK